MSIYCSTLFRDDDKAINRKVKKVLNEGLSPVLCIGETREEYEAGLNHEVCAIQILKDLADVTPEEMARVVFACKCHCVIFINAYFFIHKLTLVVNLYLYIYIYIIHIYIHIRRRACVGHRYWSCLPSGSSPGSARIHPLARHPQVWQGDLQQIYHPIRRVS